MDAGHLSTRHLGHRDIAKAGVLVAIVALGVVAGLGVATLARPTAAPIPQDLPQPPAVQVKVGPVDMWPAPNEFILAPGNLQPLGIVLTSPADIDTTPLPGEFRPAPGNLAPAGHIWSVSGITDPVPHAYYLSPGNLQPLGIAEPS